MYRMMNAKEASILWGVCDRQVSKLCSLGKVTGAIKDKRGWMIPVDADKPIDGRFKNNTKFYRAELSLPVDVSDFRLAASKYYYVDKTLMIRDFLDEGAKLALFTRPRHFGKTMITDMFRTFFEKTDEDTAVYFKDKPIWSCGRKYREQQGRYPVIHLCFREIGGNTWAETFRGIKMLLTREMYRHSELDKTQLDRLVSKMITPTELSRALARLSRMLHKMHGIAPIILIDDYDVPIRRGMLGGFEKEITDFLHKLFTFAFQDNQHLTFGFLTGVFPLNSVFAGLENLTVNSIFDEKFSEYFGFTANEVREMARYYEAEYKMEEISRWYGGYKFGSTELFHPDSVIHYFRNNCQVRTDRNDTAYHDLMAIVHKNADSAMMEQLTSLLHGNSLVTSIDLNTACTQIRDNRSALYGILAASGYLHIIRSEHCSGGGRLCEVALPNKKVAHLFDSKIFSKSENPLSLS